MPDRDWQHCQPSGRTAASRRVTAENLPAADDKPANEVFKPEMSPSHTHMPGPSGQVCKLATGTVTASALTGRLCGNVARSGLVRFARTLDLVGKKLSGSERTRNSKKCLYETRGSITWRWRGIESPRRILVTDCRLRSSMRFKDFAPVAGLGR